MVETVERELRSSIAEVSGRTAEMSDGAADMSGVAERLAQSQEDQTRRVGSELRTECADVLSHGTP
jgi:hypothetical protein